MGGLVILAGSVFAFVFLFALDFLSRQANPYVGLLAYLIAPGFFFLGLFLIVAGLVLHRRARFRHEKVKPPMLWIDTSRPMHRRRLALFVLATMAFLVVSALGSYRSYQYTESVNFCGEICHEVMKPQYVTYQHSPHARVNCSECHIGPGATWYVKTKVSGLYQVYATLFDKYPRPIEVPIHDLRPPQETCEHCHWPKKFTGNLDRTYRHYLPNKANTPFTVRLLLKVGGGDPTGGPVGGIHWHMSVGNRVEYYASDRRRQKVEWCRVTDAQGVVEEFRQKDFKGDPPPDKIRSMDCMDCHNRPSHIMKTPDEAVDLALWLGDIDPAIPGIKSDALDVLNVPYKTTDEAMKAIATSLATRHPGDARIRKAIDAVQNIYRLNFFPEMKATWKVYPNNAGHLTWDGCFRCHAGEHRSTKGRAITADCTACHIILAQGRGKQLEELSARGHPFAHPGGDVSGELCTDCHAPEDD